jgi:hypothetical protein
VLILLWARAPRASVRWAGLTRLVTLLKRFARLCRNASARNWRARVFFSMGVAAPGEAPRPMRASTCAPRTTRSGRSGTDSFRRARATRAVRERRDGPQASRRHPRAAHTAGGADCTASARRPDEPGNRRRALYQPTQRRVASEERVHEARDRFAQRLGDAAYRLARMPVAAA